MGTKAPAVARLENALASGKHSSSLDTLRKHAAALGKRVDHAPAWELRPVTMAAKDVS